jgi:hypothetical protein
MSLNYYGLLGGPHEATTTIVACRSVRASRTGRAVTDQTVRNR